MVKYITEQFIDDFISMQDCASFFLHMLDKSSIIMVSYDTFRGVSWQTRLKLKNI